MLKVYTYDGCSTCRAALKWLRGKGISFAEFPIRTTPPTRDELKAALEAHDGRVAALLNSSGQEYRRLGLKDRVPAMSEEEVLNLLAANGNLVKRPFVADAERKIFLAGFREQRWSEQLAR